MCCAPDTSACSRTLANRNREWHGSAASDLVCVPGSADGLAAATAVEQHTCRLLSSGRGDCFFLSSISPLPACRGLFRHQHCTLQQMSHLAPDTYEMTTWGKSQPLLLQVWPAGMAESTTP